MTEAQIQHLEQHQAEFDEFYTMHKPVREYVEEYAHIPDLYNNLCSDLGIEPQETT